MTDQDPNEAVARLLVRVLHDPAERPVVMGRLLTDAARQGRRIRRHRRFAAGALAAGALVAVGSAVTSGLFVRDTALPATQLASPSAAASQAATAGQDKTCGPGLPFAVHVPPGYSGPIDGPAKGAGQPDDPQQLVVHWSGSGGDIELRWPVRSAVPDPTAGSSWSVGNGDSPSVIGEMLVPDRTGECRRASLTLAWPPPDGFGDDLVGTTALTDSPRDRAERAFEALIADPAAYSGTMIRVSDLPSHSIACTGNGKRVSGTPSVPAQSTSEKALHVFLTRRSGYEPPITVTSVLQLVDQARRVAYVAPFDGGDGYVAVIWMAKRSDGWVVERYEASAC